MDGGIYLTSAGRDTLIAIILRQQAIIEGLEKRIAQLEGAGQIRLLAKGARSEAQGRGEASPAQETTQVATPRLCPRPHDAHPSGGALPRLRNPVVRRLDPAHSGSD